MSSGDSPFFVIAATLRQRLGDRTDLNELAIRIEADLYEQGYHIGERRLDE